MKGKTPITANTTETTILSTAPANNTLAPVLNRGTLDLSASKLNARTLNATQINPTTAKTGKSGTNRSSALMMLFELDGGVEVKFGNMVAKLEKITITAMITSYYPCNYSYDNSV